MPETGPERKVYAVGEITRQIKGALEQGFGSVWIEGEISNVRRPASGHMYFTIKDERAQMAAVMFRGDQMGMSFTPRDGLQVLVNGRITVYERSGQYQIVVRKMEQGGLGALQQAFEKLKKRLAEEGLFETARKQTLPTLPQRIGIVTSSTGAAVRDILKVLSRRNPDLQIVIAPARVQGASAAPEIAHQIETLNRLGGFDALIVGRGGGSLEDLWPFNEEVVARAIAASEIPIISAVGHEIDFTISDFVADVRAATPSHAAELLVERREAMAQDLRELTRRLRAALQQDLVRARARLQTASGSFVFRDPHSMVARRREGLQALLLRMRGELLGQTQKTRGFLSEAGVRMRHELQGSVRDTEQHVDELWARAERAIRKRNERAQQELRQREAQLRAMNPLAVLQRGYSVTRLPDGTIVRKRAEAPAGTRMTTQVSDGTIESEVQDAG